MTLFHAGISFIRCMTIEFGDAHGLRLNRCLILGSLKIKQFSDIRIRVEFT